MLLKEHGNSGAPCARPPRDREAGAVANGDPGWFQSWRWEPAPASPAPPLAAGTVLVFTEDPALPGEVQAALDPARHRVVAVRAGERFARGPEGDGRVDPWEPEDYRRLLRSVAREGSPVVAVLHLWNLRAIEADAAGWPPHADERRLIDDEAPLYAGVYSLLFLGQALSREAPATPLRLLAATRTACAVAPGEAPRGLSQAAAIGLALALPHDVPCLDVRVVDLEAGPAGGAGLARTLVDELRAAPTSERLTAWRRGRRFRRVLAPVPAAAAAREDAVLRPGEACLIVGGASGIGAEVALSLARPGVGLVLTGRRPLPPADEWPRLRPGTAAAARAAMVRRIQARGATVLYRAVDVSDRAAMAELMAEVRGRFGALRGVIHAAGIVDRRHPQICQKSAASVAEVLAPKLRGSLVLDAVTRAEPLRFFVLFSSLSASEARWSASLADDAAANLFLDAFSAYRSRRGGPGRSLALNWAPWRDRGTGGGLAALARAQGLRPLDPEAAVAAFRRALRLEGDVLHVVDFARERAARTVVA